MKRNYYDEMQVDLPVGVHGRLELEHFEVEANSLENLRLMLQGGRDCRVGTYTRLLIDGELWMSDTTAERYDHIDAAYEIGRRGGRILIGGLGLGMILRVALLTPEVEHVDVVELDEDVIALVGPSYEKMAADLGKSLTIHRADMMKIKWPPNTSWDVAWFDIWPTLNPDNLEDMARLARSYTRRTDWYGMWGKELILSERARGRWDW